MTPDHPTAREEQPMCRSCERKWTWFIFGYLAGMLLGALIAAFVWGNLLKGHALVLRFEPPLPTISQEPTP